MPDLFLATLAARGLVLAGLVWCMYVGLGLAVQAIGPSSLEPDEDDEEEFVGADDPCDEWDRAHDRAIDADLWPVSA